jgi:hypothetical protein
MIRSPFQTTRTMPRPTRSPAGPKAVPEGRAAGRRPQPAGKVTAVGLVVRGLLLLFLLALILSALVPVLVIGLALFLPLLLPVLLMAELMDTTSGPDHGEDR